MENMHLFCHLDYESSDILVARVHPFNNISKKKKLRKCKKRVMSCISIRLLGYMEEA